MGFLEGIAVELIAGLLTAGVLALLGLLWRWRRRKPPSPSPSPTGGGETIPPPKGRGLGGGRPAGPPMC